MLHAGGSKHLGLTTFLGALRFGNWLLLSSKLGNAFWWLNQVRLDPCGKANKTLQPKGKTQTYTLLGTTSYSIVFSTQSDSPLLGHYPCITLKKL